MSATAMFFAFSMPGTGELVVILAIILVLFGGAKIPDIARNLGRGVRELKKAMSPDSDDPHKKDLPEAKK